MKNDVKILLVDESDVTRQETKDILVNKGYWNILESNNGEDAFLKIIKYQPHIVVADMWLSKIDGIELMKKTFERSFELNVLPKFLMLSYIMTFSFVEESIKAGASICLNKNCNKEELIRNMSDLIENNHERVTYSSSNVFEKATSALHQLGIPTNVVGFQYLRSAIIIAVEDMNTINSITKILYPTVAKIYNTSSNKVERGIRHAIEVSWNKGRFNIQTLNYYNLPISSKPTNSEFIATIADNILLECKYYNNNGNFRSYK